MKSILAWLVITCVPLVLIAAFAPAPDADAKKIEYTVHANYFEARESGLRGSASYLAFTERESFDRTFGVGWVRGKPTQVLPRDLFETRFVAAVIKRGDTLWEYKVEKVTAEGDTVTVRYQATEGKAVVGATGRATDDTPKGGTYRVIEKKREPDTVKTPETTIRRAPDTEPATRKAAPETGRVERPTTEAVRATGKAISTGAGWGGTQRVIGTGREEDRAVFSSPLVISIPKGKYAAVVFVENGRKVGMARLEN
jgi:hypothetical protein